MRADFRHTSITMYACNVFEVFSPIWECCYINESFKDAVCMCFLNQKNQRNELQTIYSIRQSFTKQLEERKKQKNNIAHYFPWHAKSVQWIFSLFLKQID